MATPKIVAVPSRGNYSVKGTPQGVPIPKVPTAGSVVRGKRGVDFVYRPRGPKGAGYYKRPKALKGAAATTGTSASGATIATPPVTPVVAATPFNFGNAYVGNAQFQSTAPSLAAGQNQIGESYGLTMRRDTNSSSPTYGQPIYRLPTEKAGEGTIIASMGPKGEFVWKDAAGNAVDVAGLKVDYVPTSAGQGGYLQGALGSAVAQSENNQQTVGQQAALAGVGRSGMRAQGALAETGNLQGTLAGLTQRAQGEYASNLGKWADLYRSIYGELIPNAGSIAPPPEAPVVPPTTPSATSGTSTATTISSDKRGVYNVKGNPVPKSGTSVKKNPVGGDVVVGKSGVTWVYRPAGPAGAGWYKKGPTAIAPGKTVGEIYKNAAGVKWSWDGKKWNLI